MTDQDILDKIHADIASGTVDGVRAKILNTVARLVGSDPADDIYVANVYPCDNFVDGKSMALVQSGCGLVTEVGWRGPDILSHPDHGIVDDARLYMPYAQRVSRGGTYYAVALESDIAHKHGAWVSGEPWIEGTPLPRAADAIIMGNNTSAYARGGMAYQHEATAAYWHDAKNMTSIDGGQPGVRLRTRRLVEVWTGKNASGVRIGELWCANLDAGGNCAMGPDGRPAVGRRVVGYVNVSKLRLRSGE